MNRCLFYVINSPWVWCQWSQYLWKRDAPYQLPVLPILPFLKWTGLHCLGHFMGWDLSKEMNKTQVHYGEGNGTPLQYSCLENPMDGGAWWAAVHGVAEGWTRLSDFTFTFHFHALEKEMATHSSVLAWRIPGTGEPGGLPSMGPHRVRHDWSDLAAAAVHLRKLVQWRQTASHASLNMVPDTYFEFSKTSAQWINKWEECWWSGQNLT